LQAYEHGEGSLEQLADRFAVSHGFAKKIRQQQRKSGKMERPVRVYSTPGRLTEPMLEDLRRWVKERPDLILVELQEKTQQTHPVKVSLSTIFRGLKKLGLRLKKNSTPRNKTGKRSKKRGRSSGNR
jgi:transposase